jgi:acetate kinase
MADTIGRRHERSRLVTARWVRSSSTRHASDGQVPAATSTGVRGRRQVDRGARSRRKRLWHSGHVQILVVNAGSSSLKLRVLDGTDAVLASKDLPKVSPDGLGPILADFLDQAPTIDAAGHRVVHGGSAFTRPIVLDEAVDATLQALADLAPLHNPPCLAAVRTLQSLRPDLTQVACFDTSFHVDMPVKAATYALPRVWREEWGIRRYGFHGLSHEWASRRAGELLGRPREELRLVTAHLGGGASLAAVAFGHSVDTTMGFTPMEGLVMATRSGSVDPGLVLWVQRQRGLSAAAVEATLEGESGLLGLSGASGDLRQVIGTAAAGNEDARLAYEVYVYRIQTNVAAMVAAMEGIDALVFTGGAGEASARLRADVCARLGFLEIRLDEPKNAALGGDGVASSGDAAPAVVVVEAREDIEIARHVRALLAS